jgi:PIN domain nuclease of toxin-antitoxin system
MKVILDTHAVLWFVTSNARLSKHANVVLEGSDTDAVLSLASVWEMAIKFRLGKLNLTDPFDEFVRNEMAHNEIKPLRIELKHLMRVSHMPLHHKDPFDRLIIAQALTGNLPVISADKAFDAYGVQRIW